MEKDFERDYLVFLFGLSGAGKTTASNALRDTGFEVIDNLPPEMLDSFLQLSRNEKKPFRRSGIQLAINNEEQVQSVLKFMEDSRKTDVRQTSIFIDCSTEVILKRYSETRRPHPGYLERNHTSLTDAVEWERSLLFPLKEGAEKVIDSSDQTVHDLKREVGEFIDALSPLSSPSLEVQIMSFGFKRGVPRDVDLLIDVRFLPNPHFIDSLRPQNGLDAGVRDYVLNNEKTKQFLEHYWNLLNFLLPNYKEEGKAYLKIGIGCTGGKHRSVALAKELYDRLKEQQFGVSLRHRDMDLE